MELFICRHCGEKKKSKKSVIGHETFCKDNPHHKIQTTEAARQKANLKVACVYCNSGYTKGNLRKHQMSCRKNPAVIQRLSRVCPVCDKVFVGTSFTCSYSCSNTYFRHGREGGSQYTPDEKLVEDGRYRDLCFRYHEKKCIICGEENVISVHHLNENHDDNRPENLVPLCPTHHQYCHSRFYHLVEQKIQEYMTSWKIKFDILSESV